MNSLFSDLRYAFRSLRRSAGFAAVSIATLAIGVGANVAVFSAIRAVLIEDLPYHEPDRIVQLWQPVPKMLPQLFFADDVAAMQGTHAFTAMGACATTPSRESINAPGAPERVQTTGVTRSFFSIFGVTPVAGRAFDDGDFVSADRVAIISFRVWQSQFGGRQDAIGSVIHIDRTPWSVVGVMPASFSPGCMPRSDIGVWQPIYAPTPGNTRTEFYVFARLAPSATLESAQEQLDAVKVSKPTVTFGAYGARVEQLGEQQAGRVRPGLLLLQGVAALLLLLTCATLANLFLVRASSRRQELGVRSALGAGRLKLVQQLLSEAVLVAAAGGTLGVGIAVWAVPALVRSSPVFPPTADISVRLPELAVGLVVGLGTAILFGLLPAVLTSRVDVLASLKGSVQMTASRAVALFRTGLVAAEVLLAVIVLVGTALLLRSVAHIAMMPLGLDPKGLVVAQVELPPEQYSTQASWRRFADRLQNTLTQRFGPASVTLANNLPFQGMTSSTFALVPTGGQSLIPRYSVIRNVAPDYFATLRVPLIQGRLFGPGDAAGSTAVAIVTETFAREFGNGEPVLTRRIRVMREPGREFVVVGVVSDTRSGVLSRSVFPAVYTLWEDWPSPSVSVAVRGDVRTAEQRIREAVHEMDAQLPLADLESLELKISRSEATRRFYLQMLMVFGGLAGVVAILGVYSVTRHVVSLRMRELGIRVALGARARDIRTLLIGRGLRPVVVGLAGGLLASWWLAVTLAAQSEALRFQLLFEIPAQDPIAFICAAVSVLSFSALALWVPTRVANRLDPVQVLRAE